MVHSCIVPGCSSRSNKVECKGIKFFTLPTTHKILEIWLLLIGRKSTEVSFHSRICSKHFIGGEKTKDSVPEIFPWQKRPTVRDQSTSTCTHPNLSPSDIVNHDHTYCSPVLRQSQVPPTHVTPITESTVSVSSFVVNAQTQTSTSHFCIEEIADNDTAIHFYTGFCDFRTLIICFEFLGKSVHHLKYWGSNSKVSSIEKRGTSRSLTPLNEFFLVLCRLRCGLMETDLSYRFQISQSTVSRIIITWINFIFFKFKDIPIWPCRQQINHFMPQLFKEFYPTTRCIIDATEIFIQSPSNPQAQQLTFSSYKNHNTLKALVAITPSGAISFISKLHGGSTSDRELFLNSGLLELLEPGDSVMADRGFTIADLLDAKVVSLNIPPRKVNDQLSDTKLITTRRIAALRIHVERAIGRIKSFKILHDLPNNMNRITDQIFFVCCMLCNFSSPLCNK